MKRPSYKAYMHLIQRDIDLRLMYSFTYLSMIRPDKSWTIDRRTLERAREAGELICATPTMIKGEWLLDWLGKTPEQRQTFARSKFAREHRVRVA